MNICITERILKTNQITMNCCISISIDIWSHLNFFQLPYSETIVEFNTKKYYFQPNPLFRKKSFDFPLQTQQKARSYLFWITLCIRLTLVTKLHFFLLLCYQEKNKTKHISTWNKTTRCIQWFKSKLKGHISPGNLKNSLIM